MCAKTIKILQFECKYNKFTTNTLNVKYDYKIKNKYLRLKNFNCH